jgi:hypothetical protein
MRLLLPPEGRFRLKAETTVHISLRSLAYYFAGLGLANGRVSGNTRTAVVSFSG